MFNEILAKRTERLSRYFNYLGVCFTAVSLPVRLSLCPPVLLGNCNDIQQITVGRNRCCQLAVLDSLQSSSSIYALRWLFQATAIVLFEIGLRVVINL